MSPATHEPVPEPARHREPELGQAVRYATGIDLFYDNTSQAKAIHMVGWNKRVLEVGPATGSMTALMQQRGCRVTGIEIDPEAAKSASQYCEEMIVGDVETLDLEEALGDGQFDMILFADVLEHLVDPGRTLRRLSPYLAPDGSICASIPNIAHGSVRLALLAGDFDYEEKGLLDETHLRFFNRAGIEELFAGNGFAVTEWERVEVDLFSTELGIRAEDYPRSLIDSIRRSPEYLTYQFVVRARPSDGADLLAHRDLDEHRSHVKDMFEPLWEAELKVWELQQVMHGLHGAVQSLEHELSHRDTHVAQLEARAGDLQHRLDLIVNRTNYQLWQKLVTKLDELAPWGTRRRRLILMPGYAVRILLEKGPGGLLKHLLRVWHWGPRLFQKAMHPSAAAPRDRYKVWEDLYVLSPQLIKAMQRKAKKFTHQPYVSIVMPVYNPDPRWLEEAIQSVIGQIYTKWELCIADDGSTRKGVSEVLDRFAGLDSRVKVQYLDRNQGITAASSAALEMATGDYVGFLDHDDELKANALYQVVKTLNERPELDYIYSDLDHKTAEGELKDPFRKPDWSPDLLRSCNYVTHFSVFSKTILDKVGGFRPGFDGSQDWDLVLRVTEATDRIEHIRACLYTWRQVPGSAARSGGEKPWAHEAAKRAIADSLRREGADATVEPGPYLGYYRVKYRIVGAPLVSIIVPMRDRLDLLRTCIASIRERTTWSNYEIVIVDNDSREQQTLDYLESFPGRVVRHPGPFNFSQIINHGAAEVSGDYLLLLNNDTEVITPGWIEAMLEHAQRDEVAAVGARLLFRDGRAQHEGVIVGPGNGLAGNVDYENYFGLGRCIHNASAVTGACMLTRAEVFHELAGFDEKLTVAYNDVDYCLRAGEKGYRILYTPYAELYHDEAATRGHTQGDHRAHPVEDEEYFRLRWSGYADPFDPPSLKIDHPLVPIV